MYHIFFIHSSVDGHLGWFHVLAIVNSAAMNKTVALLFVYSVLSFCELRQKNDIRKKVLLKIHYWNGKRSQALNSSVYAMAIIILAPRS